jgi:hypothetical protein
MDEFTIVTVIRRPVDEVFAVLVDMDRMPLWAPGLSEMCVTSDGPLEAGSTMLARVTFLGRSFESQMVCADLTENKNFATRSTAGPIYLETDAYMDSGGAARCGLPAAVEYRYSMRSTDGPLESVKIRCPRGHCFNGPLESMLWDKAPAGPPRLRKPDAGRLPRGTAP